MLINDDVRGFHQVKQEGRRNVVGEISHDAQAFIARDFLPIKRQRVGFDERQLLLRELGFQPPGQIPIDFDGAHVTGSRNQLSGQRRLTRADFYDGLSRFGIHGFGDASDPVFIL